MQGLATWLAALRLRRALVIGGLFPLPILGVLSSAVIVMTAELKGPREALLDCAFAFVALGLMAWLAGADLTLLLPSAAISWVVWLGLGTLVGRTGSLTLGIQAAVMVALVGLIAFDVLIGDPVAYWSDTLDEVFGTWVEQGLLNEDDLVQLAGLMSGLVMAGSLTSGMLVMLLGTALASRINGAGWSGQFAALRLGYVIGGLAAIAGLAALFGLGLDGALLVLGVAFMFHGIAVVSCWSSRRNWPKGWWIGLLILPVLLPQFLIIEAALLSALGFVDNWFDLRRADGPA